jgi:hypothetical protein
MIYFIDIEKQDKFNDGTLDDSGIFYMKEHFNMSTVATFTNIKMCERVIKMLNEEDAKREKDYRMMRFDPAI